MEPHANGPSEGRISSIHILLNTLLSVLSIISVDFQLKEQLHSSSAEEEMGLQWDTLSSIQRFQESANDRMLLPSGQNS
jgi:hypothetical protein